MDSSSIRHIVLLSDGTGNSRGKRFTTNVWRVYEALDLADPADPIKPRQFAFYDDGVGSSSFRPWALLSGALGIGLARNVRDLYSFLCRTYRPGDRIYCFGFSRGAFTIRVLVGLIVNQGIVPYSGDETELERLVSAAYRAYRRRYRLPINYIGPLRDLRDGAIAWWARVRGLKAYADVVKIIPAGPDPRFKIDFLGLWDTVDAYGLPVDEMMLAVDKLVWPLTMRDLRLDPSVRQAVHALSLDDERNTFHPRLWRDDDPAPASASAPAEAQPVPKRISQVWFAGMHADVGGGYPDQGLSHVSLDWITAAAAGAGLRLVERLRANQQGLSDENGPMNDSRRGLAGYYRYNPRRLEKLFTEVGGARPVVHESVLRRIRVGQDAYAPIVLPPGFDVLRLDGSMEEGAAYLKIDASAQQRYAEGRERVFNLVWWRRVAYFGTLAATVVLLALPFLSDKNDGACTSSLCALSPLIRALDVVLPAMLAGWTQWYAVHPVHFTLLAVLVGLGLYLGGTLQRAIGDAMRRAWYAIAETRPSSLRDGPPSQPAGKVERAIQWLRTQPWYTSSHRVLTRFVLPAGFLAVLAGGAAMLLSVASFNVQSSYGAVCSDSPSATFQGPSAREHRLDTQRLCAATATLLEAGGTYRLVITLPQEQGRPTGWKDGGIEADLRGVRPEKVGWLVQLGTPLRREAAQPWLMPMARIGSRGTDLYPLAPDPSVPFDSPLTVLHACLVARSSGELFLYVNDAVGPPGMSDLFYLNNRGTATVSVSRVEAAAAGPMPRPTSGGDCASP